VHKMKVGIVVRTKHGDLMEGLAKRGWNQRQGAQFLGISEQAFGKIINLTRIPKEFSPELTIKLFELTGKTLEELFPDWTRQNDFLIMSEISKKITGSFLLMPEGNGTIPCPPPTPEEVFCREEVRKRINEVLLTLSPREEQVVRRHAINGENFGEIGNGLCLSTARVQQICVRAMLKLRHPRRARILRDCLFEIS
jgi:RNA polymerase sigma factor (sigma-70 family)